MEKNKAKDDKVSQVGVKSCNWKQGLGKLHWEDDIKSRPKRGEAISYTEVWGGLKPGVGRA